MSDVTSIEVAKRIMGNNFIGKDELISTNIFNLQFDSYSACVPFSEQELMDKKDDYILIYGSSRFENGNAVSIKNIKDIFGESSSNKPVFYTQDWYDKEEFINIPLEEGWFFIRITPYEDSRAVDPTNLIRKYTFPSAIKCVYSFFVVWLVRDVKLWYTDFVWCNDVDHNGDRIYVGKYHDVDGVNRDGFSIHRHLALRSCYTCID